MNDLERISTAAPHGLNPATAALPLMLQANGHATDPGQRGCEEGNNFDMNLTNKNVRQLSDHLRYDERLAMPEGPAQRPIRVAFYSHDTMGLGHLRRNLLIAQSLADSPLQVTTLLITGAHEANFFSLPPGTDLLTLPRMHKDEAGRYTAGQLAISIEDLVSLRAESICSALDAFRPDVLIVDKVPTGAFGEMLPALRRLPKKFDTKCVLGIRDVLDEAKVVRSEWFQSSHEAIDDFYEEIWVYGDRQIYNPVEEYGWHEGIASKVRHTGYLEQASHLTQLQKNDSQNLLEAGREGERLIVCALGGGQDGFHLAETFVDAMPQAGVSGVLLAGPFMPTHLLSALQERASQHANLRVMEFTPEADLLLSRADRVVAMGGYNTVCAILSFRKPGLLVPRVSPRSEQWIRAQRLEQRGLVDVLHPDDLTPAALSAWFEKEIPSPCINPKSIDFAGLERITQFVTELVGQQTGNHATSSQRAV